MKSITSELEVLIAGPLILMEKRKNSDRRTGEREDSCPTSDKIIACLR